MREYHNNLSFSFFSDQNGITDQSDTTVCAKRDG